MISDLLVASWPDLDVGDETSVAPGWMESFVPFPKRVITGGSDVGVAVDLPEAESLPDVAGRRHDSVTDDCDMNDIDAGENGTDQSGAAVAWAIAYRDGLATGRTVGYAQGVAEGREIGVAAARAEGRALAEQAIAAMASQLERVLATLEDTVTGVAGEATELAFGVARAILDREITTSTDPGGEAIARAARLLPDTAANGADQLVIRLNPTDIAALGDIEADILAGHRLQLIPDAEISSGSCRMDLGATRLDASVDRALDRVRTALTC